MAKAPNEFWRYDGLFDARVSQIGTLTLDRVFRLPSERDFGDRVIGIERDHIVWSLGDLGGDAREVACGMLDFGQKGIVAQRGP
jgi:hypothetical protein